MIFGFQQGIATGAARDLEEVVFVERKSQRYEVLRNALDDVELVGPSPITSSPAEAPDDAVVTPPEPEGKKRVFVAMPFQEEFEDVYQFGIYAAVRRCGYVCEKVDESVFAGSIVERITEGIRDSEFIIADLTYEKPNVLGSRICLGNEATCDHGRERRAAFAFRSGSSQMHLLPHDWSAGG
jgi:hypothetical protein